MSKKDKKKKKAKKNQERKEKLLKLSRKVSEDYGDLPIAANQSMFIEIGFSEFCSLLGISQNSVPSNIAGWEFKIQGSDIRVVTKYLPNSGQAVSTSELSNFQFVEFVNGNPAASSFNASNYFPAYDNQSAENIEMYFLNASELNLAVGNREYSKVLISISILQVSYYFSEHDYPPAIPFMKFELIVLPSYNIPVNVGTTPSLLVATPCPPVWRPGLLHQVGSSENDSQGFS